MLPIALGLSAATCIGFSNIIAGISARRLSPLIVGFWSQATGTVWCALLLLALRPPLVSGQVSGGLIAGLAGGAGMVLFYQAMTTGAISLIAPITACSIVFPVIYAIASGETPTVPVAAGLVAIVSGIVLASLRPTPVRGDPPDTRIATDRRAIALAVAAAAAFGAFFILIDFAPPVSGWGALWTAGGVRVSGFAVQVALALLGPRRLAWPGRYAPAVALAGTLDLTALVLISFGAMTDAYGIVTALVGLYPVIVTLLGVAFLGERLTRAQATGATLAMVGVLLVSI
ncbi:MAG TPA: EamA family transporter [Thermomicrobiales bacterium]|nr:EamA family transporter [Thermomicrobiales bacterium]